MRRRGGVRILVLFGLFSGVYGARMLLQVLRSIPTLPVAQADRIQDVVDIISYCLLIIALLFWRTLSLDKLKRFNEIAMIPAVLIAVVGIGLVVSGRPAERIMPLNNGLAICVVLVLLVVTLVPKLARRNLAVPARALAIGSIAFALIALYVNLERFLGLPRADAWEPLGFTIFVLSLGYVTAEKVFSNERRLLSIENELEIARNIQKSILPGTVPELEKATVTAEYHPMTSVAGDFYEFVVVDRHRAGILVADVSGHGVPAALIASMIKVAMQSVVDHADDPGQVLRGLNRVLSSQLRGQFVTAAYVWLDIGKGRARYSAAGHPPLLYWRAATGELQRIESNGLLFGVLPDSEYPVREFDLEAGDCLLLYTDGVVEAENTSGESFGDARLEEVVRSQRGKTVAEMSNGLMEELRKWQPAAAQQQDDITLVVVGIE
jgi:sigma-B regulation protein RsbU (phosphoserine phosphatase)